MLKKIFTWLKSKPICIKIIVITCIFSIFVVALIHIFSVKELKGYAPNLQVLKQQLKIIDFDLNFRTQGDIYYIYNTDFLGGRLLYFYGKMDKTSITDLLTEKHFHVLKSPEWDRVFVHKDLPPQMITNLEFKSLITENGIKVYDLKSPDSNVISFSDRKNGYYILLKVSEMTGSFVGIFQFQNISR